MDENESKLKNILGRLSELDAAVQALLRDPLTEPIEKEPLETEPLETEPLETEPLETEPLETEPLETEPLETEPLETEPLETEPLETEPLETEPLETEPLETEPLETKSLNGDDIGIGVYETDSTFQKGGWITNKRMDNLEWRMEALETSISHCYGKVDTHNNMINDLKTKVDNVLSTFNVLEEDDSIKNKWIGEAGDIRDHPEGPMIRLLPFNSKFKPGWQNQSKNEKNEVNNMSVYDDEDDEDDVSE